MTTTEFSNEFDILYNNIKSNQAPGLDEYEKSVFLTKAQSEIVKNYFNPKGNKYQEGFDDSAKRQIDFSMLMKSTHPSNVISENPIHLGGNVGFYKMPDDILLYINEFLDVKRRDYTNRLVVVPLSNDEYNRVMSKPYNRPLKNQAWRLITSGEGTMYTYTKYGDIAKILAEKITNVPFNIIYTKINNKELVIESNRYLKVDGRYLCKDGSLTVSNTVPNNAVDVDGITISSLINANVEATSTVVQLIPGNNDIITNYLVRYIRRPRPIILENLGKLSIEGEKDEQSCELDSSLHQEILQRAVELAKSAFDGNINTIIETGKRSE